MSLKMKNLWLLSSLFSGLVLARRKEFNTRKKKLGVTFMIINFLNNNIVLKELNV